jgi:predicted DsbA family dithiol-disulfide isomerase
MAPEARRVEVFAEIACPFSHVCIDTLVAERSRRGTTSPRLAFRAWPLELVNGRAMSPRRVAEEIAALRAQVAPHLFRAFDATRVPSSSIGAFGLAAAASRLGDDIGEAVGLALRRAVFEEGRDLVDDRVLREIGAPFGVQPLSLADATAAVDADWQAGRARGVKGSPHFFVGDRDWFSPSLEIEKDATGTITVRRDDATLADVYAAGFGGSTSV